MEKIFIVIYTQYDFPTETWAFKTKAKASEKVAALVGEELLIRLTFDDDDEGNLNYEKGKEFVDMMEVEYDEKGHYDYVSIDHGNGNYDEIIVQESEVI